MYKRKHPFSDMDAIRRAAFPNTEPAHCVHGCNVAKYTNKIIASFYDPAISDHTLKDRARRAMGLRQNCPRRDQNRPCRAMAFKHLLLMRILNELPAHPNPEELAPPEALVPPETALQQLRLDEPEPVDATGDAPAEAPAESSTPISRKPPVLSCPICFDSLVETDEQVLALDCGHILCHECFIPLLEEDEPNPHELAQDLSEDEDTLKGLFVPCPVCRKRCKKPRRLYPFWRPAE